MNNRGAIRALPIPRPTEGDRRIRAGSLELAERKPVAFPGSRLKLTLDTCESSSGSGMESITTLALQSADLVLKILESVKLRASSTTEH
jgi:hypothetical protein